MAALCHRQDCSLSDITLSILCIRKVHILTWWMIKMLRIWSGFTYLSMFIFYFLTYLLICKHFFAAAKIKFFDVILCSKYDLYSKSKVLVDVEEVKPYYLSLIEKVGLNSYDLVNLIDWFIYFNYFSMWGSNFLIGFVCSISLQSLDGEKQQGC